MKDPFEIPDLQPRAKKVRLTEGKIQKKCVAYARSKGYWARKFSSPSQRSVPDYLFGKLFHREGAAAEFRVFGVANIGASVKWAEEFKAPGKRPSEAQIEEQDLMMAAGWTVYRDTGRCGEEDVVAFKRRIDALEEENI